MITLNAQGLGKHFGFRWIFRDLSFEAGPGVLGVEGINGSGKSTLLRCLAGLQKQDIGEIHWADDGSEVNRADLRSINGYAAPYIQLYGELTVFENLEFLYASRTGGREKDADSSFETVISNELELAGISSKIDALYKSLSSGQQQRVKLIAAVQHQPKILFLDEPGTNLDENGFSYMCGLIDRRREGGTITVLASNDSRELDLCETRVLVRQHGT